MSFLLLIFNLHPCYGHGWPTMCLPGGGGQNSILKLDEIAAKPKKRNHDNIWHICFRPHRIPENIHLHQETLKICFAMGSCALKTNSIIIELKIGRARKVEALQIRSQTRPLEKRESPRLTHDSAVWVAVSGDGEDEEEQVMRENWAFLCPIEALLINHNLLLLLKVEFLNWDFDKQKICCWRAIEATAIDEITNVEERKRLSASTYNYAQQKQWLMSLDWGWTTNYLLYAGAPYLIYIVITNRRNFLPRIS